MWGLALIYLEAACIFDSQAKIAQMVLACHQLTNTEQGYIIVKFGVFSHFPIERGGGLYAKNLIKFLSQKNF